MVILISVKCGTEGCAGLWVLPIAEHNGWPTESEVVARLCHDGWRWQPVTEGRGAPICPRCIIAEDAPVVEPESVEPAEWESRR